MKMQQLIDSRDVSTNTKITNAVVYAVGKVYGPFQGKNGEFYTQGFMVGDGSITGTYDKDSQTFDKKGEWVSFYKPKFDLKKGDHINFEMSLNKYQGKYKNQGKRIELVTADTISGISQEDFDGLRNAADVVLNAFYDAYKAKTSKQQADKLLSDHAAEVDLIWPPEGGI
jgi:hypothetical protein